MFTDVRTRCADVKNARPRRATRMGIHFMTSSSIQGRWIGMEEPLGGKLDNIAFFAGKGVN